jgi:hypothetical protein
MLVYLAAAASIAAGEHAPLDSAVCFDPDRTPEAPFGRQVAAGVMAIGGVGALFGAPFVLAVLALRRGRWAASYLIGSLALNTAALIALVSLLREAVGVGRVALCAAWGAWTLLLAAFAWRRGEGAGLLAETLRRWGPPLALGTATVVASLALLFPEQALQCFNEDGTETYELARSLRAHALPAWELEVWDLGLASRIGTVVTNPSLVNSYWTCAALVLLGDGEVATRVAYWVWWLGIYLLSCRIVSATTGARPLLPAMPLAVLMFLNALLFTFYVGYNPYMADLANPGVPDALFTLCLLGGLDSLRTADRTGFVLSFLLASLVLYAGPVLLLLTLGAALVWRPLPWRRLLGWGAVCAGLIGLAAAGYVLKGASEGLLDVWLAALDVEYVSDYLAPVPRTTSALLFFGYFLLGVGVIPAWGLATSFRGAAWQRTAATVTLLYLAIVLCAGYKNLHYLAPLWPVSLVLFLSGPRQQRRSRVWTRPLLASVSLLVALALAWPQERHTFTLNRQLGRQTTFATDSYLEAVQWGRLRYTLRRTGAMSWDCDQHTWVAYAERAAAPGGARPFLLTGRAWHDAAYEPVAFRRVEGTDVVALLYVNDPEWLRWLHAQRPLPPERRYAPVFRPLARGPHSPHGNLIQDHQRLYDIGRE